MEMGWIGPCFKKAGADACTMDKRRLAVRVYAVGDGVVKLGRETWYTENGWASKRQQWYGQST